MKRNTWLLLIVGLLIAGGGYYAWQQQQITAELAAEAEADDELQTATVRRGNIVISAVGSGTVIPANIIDIGFKTAGTFSQLNVAIGEKVTAGDVLALLDDSSLQDGIADAELALAQAKLNIDPDRLAQNIALAEIQVKQAQLNLDAANDAVTDLLEWEPETDVIALEQARLSVQAAENSLARVKANAGDSTLSIAQSELSLASAQTNLANFKAQGVDYRQTDVASAELSLQSAQQNLNDLLNWAPDSDQVAILQANLNSSTQNLQAIRASAGSANTNAITQAEIQLQQAQQELANAQSAVTSSDGSVLQAEIALENAQEDLADAQAAHTTAFDPGREWETHSRENVCQNGQQPPNCTGQRYDERIANERESAIRNLERAQENLSIAEANLATAKSSNSTNLQRAQDDVRIAQANLDAAKSGNTNTTNSNNVQIANADAQVKSAQLNLAQAQEKPDETVIQDARDAVRLAELQLQNVRDGVSDNSTNYTASLASMESAVTLAELSLKQARENASSQSTTQATDIVSAEISLQQAQLNLQQQTDASGDDVEANQDAITAAQREVEQRKLALEQADLNLMSAKDTAQSDLSVQQAESNLAAAQARLTDAQIIAPVSGTILAISAEVGEAVSTTPIISIGNLDVPVLEIFVDESDLDKVGTGFPAEVIFNAFPDDAFVGEITQVDPQLTVEGGVSTVRAEVQLTDYNKGQALPVGLNASVEIIGGQANNTLLVPVEAVRELTPGQFALFKIVDGEPELTFIEVGLSDFTFAEILSGVEQGDVVSTGLIETN